MQQINLHKLKLIALAIALVSIIFMFLTWSSVNKNTIDENFNQINISSSDNGFNSTGFLCLIGIIGVVAATLFLGDKTKGFEGQAKLLVLGSFGAIILGAILYLIIAHGSGIGLWLELIAGIAGAVLVSGVLNQMGAKTTTGSLPTTSSTPPNPPAPPPTN